MNTEYKWQDQRVDLTELNGTKNSRDQVGTLDDVDHGFKREAGWKEKFDRKAKKAFKKLGLPCEGWKDSIFNFRSTSDFDYTNLPHPDNCLREKEQPDFESLIKDEPTNLASKIRKAAKIIPMKPKMAPERLAA